jgi:hypothetical protein
MSAARVRLPLQRRMRRLLGRARTPDTAMATPTTSKIKEQVHGALEDQAQRIPPYVGVRPDPPRERDPPCAVICKMARLIAMPITIRGKL